MANIFSSIGKLFGFGKKKTTPQPQQNVFGPRSIKETPEGAQFVKTLQERLAGRGVGFRPEVIAGATAPFAAQQRPELRERTIPTISAQASARGVGRSTIPVGQIGQASAGVERDIASRVAELSLADEQQRRAEINAALTGIGNVAQVDIGLRQDLSAQNLAEFNRLQKFEAGERAERQAGAGRLATLATTAIGAAIGGPAGAVVGAQIGNQIFSGSGQGGATTTNDLNTILEELRSRTGGSVNIARGGRPLSGAPLTVPPTFGQKALASFGG